MSSACATSAFCPLSLEGDEKIGSQIVRRAIEHPLKQLCANAGVDGGVVVKEVLSGKGNHGYNVATDKFEDLVKAGVVDPTKVTRTALQNAASIAGLFLTVERMITEIPYKKESAPAYPPGGGGMDRWLSDHRTRFLLDGLR